MIKAHRRQVAGGHPLLAAPATRLRISFELAERGRDRLAVGCD